MRGAACLLTAVAAVCLSAVAGAVAAVDATGPRTASPTVPTALRATKITRTSISVAWRAGRGSGSGVTYRVYRDGRRVASTARRSHTFAGLLCGRAYRIAVEAVDRAGKRSPRRVLRTSTLACGSAPPPPPPPVTPPPPPAKEPSVFVRSSGSDANPCTAAAPCESFNRAYRVAQPGDVVEVAAGTYPEQTILVDPDKTSAADVVFRPAPGAAVAVADIEIHARHLEIRDLTTTGVGTHATAADVTVRDVRIRGGFFIQSSQNVSIIGGSVGPGRDFHPTISAAYLSEVPPRQILIDGVDFHDWTRSGPAVHTECLQIGGGDGITIRNSRFRNCHVMDIHVSWWGDAPRTKNVTIENNFLSESGSGGFHTIQAYAFENLLIRNNSMEQAFVIFTDDPERSPNVNVRVIGNVGPRTPRECEDGVIFRHNVWTGARCGATDLEAPSGFVDPSAGDFHLRPGAAAIDRGDPASFPETDFDGDRRPRGAAPDAGADER